MSRFRVPHTLILLSGMILLAWLMTWVLPQGKFERITNEGGREQVVAGTYQKSAEGRDYSPASIGKSLWQAAQAIPKAFAAAQEIIFFVFLIGGCFAVLRATGAIDALLGYLLDTFGQKPAWLIGGGIVLFAVGSTTIGMAEEYIPFIPVILALAIGLGFDAVTAIGIVCIGYGIGYGTAIFNPFTVLIAQQVAEVQPTSGMGYRLVLTVIFLVVGIHHVWSYAKKVKANPAHSLVADIEPDPAWKTQRGIKFLRRHMVVLGLTACAIGLIVWGLSQTSGWHWYIVEMGAVFLILAVVLAIVGGLDSDHAAKEFCVGATELATTALLIGFARAILIVLEEGQVIDTIVHGISIPLQHTGSAFAAVGMMFFQSLCNLFIPSGSGQAYVTMPVMAPLGDLVGVQRQVAVLAYQFGDGFTNIMVPTNAVLIGILTMARIPYERWLRFILPFMVKVWIVGGIALAVAVMIGYS